MITFTFTEFSGKSHHCDCCGYYSSSGKSVFVNEELVWEEYFDGHLGGHQTPSSILYTVTNKWNDIIFQNISHKYSEQRRLDYLKEKPNNHIASSLEYWQEDKHIYINMQQNDYQQVLDSCNNLPYNEFIQLKMIALWIESVTGEKIEVFYDKKYEEI